MAVIHDTARDVDVRHRVAVEQQLLTGVVEEKRCYRECPDQQSESCFSALLPVALAQDCLISFLENRLSGWARRASKAGRLGTRRSGVSSRLSKYQLFSVLQSGNGCLARHRGELFRSEERRVGKPG